jgi:hypothetical protein
MLDIQGSEKRRREEGIGAQYGSKQLHNQIRQLQNQMRTVSKRLGLHYTISSEDGSKERAEGDDTKS